MIIRLMDEENVKRAISTAEKSLKNCWAKLIRLQSETASKEVQFDTLSSFQPTLLSTLVEIESFYNEVCECGRELVSKKTSVKQEMFAAEMQKLERYKELLDEVIDVGKSMGDAFAWIFYQRNRLLLKKHFQHEFIPRLPTRLGGMGEVEFIRNHQMFGRYFVLSHSITTFLREGDVSLIDSRDLSVATIADLKTQKLGETEAQTMICWPGTIKLPEEMLPATSTKQKPAPSQAKKLEPQIVDRLKRQMERIEKVFEQSPSGTVPEKLGMTLACSKLQELFEQTSPNEWGQVRVGKGLLLVGIKSEDSSFVSRLTDTDKSKDGAYRRNLERVPTAAVEIVDKNLPDNGLIIGSMLYRAKERYELALRMRPVFWWPLSAEVREAITFKQMWVMTLYNPAFLISELRRIGLDVEFKKTGGILISKKYGEGCLKLVGVDYLYEMIQTHLLREETIVELLRKSIENVEKANVKRTTYVDLDFDFVFQ